MLQWKMNHSLPPHPQCQLFQRHTTKHNSLIYSKLKNIHDFFASASEQRFEKSDDWIGIFLKYIFF